MSNIHPLFADLLQRHFDAAESRHYAAIDAADARDEWCEQRVTELMDGDLASEIGELSPIVYKRFEDALNAFLRAPDDEIKAKRDALWDVFGEHFKAQAEREYDRRSDDY